MRIQGVILAGGEGARLKNRYGSLSKPLVPVNGSPMIEHAIKALSFMGINNICIVCNKNNLLGIAEVADTTGCRITYALQKDQLGISSALSVIPHTADWYTIMHCDLYLHDLKHTRTPLYFGLWSSNNNLLTGYASDVSDYGELQHDGTFVEKPPSNYSGKVMLGLYHINNDALFDLCHNVAVCSRTLKSESEYFNSTNITFQEYENSWIDMGTPERILEAENLMGS
jgi:dTDP-glucose pyrophosphorylase